MKFFILLSVLISLNAFSSENYKLNCSFEEKQKVYKIDAVLKVEDGWFSDSAQLVSFKSQMNDRDQSCDLLGSEGTFVEEYSDRLKIDIMSSDCYAQTKIFLPGLSLAKLIQQGSYQSNKVKVEVTIISRGSYDDDYYMYDYVAKCTLRK
jgi:hypothetical protein